VKLKISVGGKVYEVDVEVAEPERPSPNYAPIPGKARVPAAPAAQPAAPRPAADAPVADEAKVCRTPIAGVVVKVAAQPGQTIQVNDVLLVLEAMKMETVVTAPIAGKVKKINAAAGDAVLAGQVLVEFE
jgi:biotin carboxyl carrier protein